MLTDLIRERGPMTVAAFMDLALYDPQFGYYARAPRRSGRAGDFFTSVDVGGLFGELLAVQVAEMAEILTAVDAKDAEGRTRNANVLASASSASSALMFFDLVEAGAGDGRLSADILRAARLRAPEVYDRAHLHLVESSAAARRAQRATLGEAAARLETSTRELPSSFEGVLLANELLDAMPVHQVVMRDDGLRETYVSACGHAGTRARQHDACETSTCGGGAPREGRKGWPPQDTLVLREGPLSTPALADYLKRLNVSLEPGWRVEINLSAVDWVRDAARRLRRGFIILIDYGHEARELYSVTHATGTLATFSRHTTESAGATATTASWLVRPGEQDITAHVDFTSVRAAAEAEGLVTLGFLDQTYFLLGLVASIPSLLDAPNLAEVPNLANAPNLKRRLALKTLVMPGGLGSTMKVLILGKGVGAPALRGCSFRMRAT